jgi:hypothetical protein
VNDKQQERTEITDYLDVLRGDGVAVVPVVVGGQAVNAWAMYYSERLGAKIDGFRPFTSKDLDVAGNREMLEYIQRVTRGSIFYSEPRSPVIGYVEASFGSRMRRIEVLRHVRGLGSDEIADYLRLRIGDTEVCVLAPPMVLKAKLCNVCTLEQELRNDVNHLRIMILCVREFILDLLARVIDGDGSQRDLVDLLEEIREITTSREASGAEALWKLDFSQVWPRQELVDSRLQKVARFLQHRLP